MILDNIKLNFKLNKSYKAFFVLFLVSQILSLIGVLFSTSIIVNQELIQKSGTEFCISFSDDMTYSSCVEKISQLGVENCKIMLDDSDIFFVSYPKPTLTPHRGDPIDIDNPSYQAVVGDMGEDNPLIGDIFEYNDVNYTVVGVSREKNIVELSANSVAEGTLISSVQIQKLFNSQRKMDKFAKELGQLFETEQITAPAKNTFSINIIYGNPLMMIIIGIMLLAIITILIGYQFFLKKREKNYRILRVIGETRGAVTASIFLEIAITTAFSMIVASIVYFIMDILFIRKNIGFLFSGTAYILSLKYYFITFLLFLTLCYISAIPALSSLYKKNKKVTL